MSIEQPSAEDTQVRKSIEERIATTLKISAYIRAAEKFEQASKDFAEACAEIRNNLQPSRFVTKVDYKSYLVTIEENKDFKVEPIEML